jgi:hypothetical protein
MTDGAVVVSLDGEAARGIVVDCPDALVVELDRPTVRAG